MHCYSVALGIMENQPRKSVETGILEALGISFEFLDQCWSLVCKVLYTKTQQGTANLTCKCMPNKASYKGHPDFGPFSEPGFRFDGP